MFKGKNTSSGGENASRSLLLETAFRYDPEKEDLEGIFNPPSPITANPPDSTPLRSVPHNVSGQIVESEDSGLKNLQEIPSPPPQPTPQHQANPVKDLVSRFRKQTGKEQKNKDATVNAKEPQQKDVKDKKEEKTLKEPPKEIKDRSRSPSPGGDRENREKDKENAPQENRDGSWFGGIKGKIVKKIEEKRSRSQSMPVVPKGPFEQRADEDRDDDDVVERAEEASPETMAFEQEIADSSDKSPGLKTVHELVLEDDSWEKIDFPVGDESQENIFYRDFGRVKERWLALDSAYIARAFPDIVEEIRTLSLRTLGVLCAVLTCLFCVPLPSFMQGFIIASLSWWTYNVICGFLWPSDPPSRRIPDANEAPNSMLLMPRYQEIGFLEGWMNALPAGEPYDVRTHLGSHCHSVHVRLSGTTLRIRTPKDKLPRRAMWNEKHKDINSVVWLGKQWFLKLEGATVRLLPEGLSASRLWNKKYPITISVPAQGTEEAKEVFLFARTCRDKEHWFRLLKNASEVHLKNQGNRTPETEKEEELVSEKKQMKSKDEDESPTVRPPVNFLVYMNNLAFTQRISHEVKTPDEKKTFAIQPSCPSMALEYRDGDTQWVNLVVGRILYDFFTQPRWAEAVRAKFQKKLSKIKVPFFMEELTITDIDLGECIPLIRRTSAAVHCPNTGVWLDVELAYNGSFQVTVNTKLNLMKLKKQGLHDKPLAAGAEQEMQEMTLSMDLGHDDEPPSEDDDDDDSNGNQPNDAELEEAQGATSKRILDMVDRISQWSLFQQATETAYIKKKMEEFSNTDLKLTIQLTSLVGRLALNIPPPPTDRLWYGFRSVPRLEFKATPQMGFREISFKQKLAAVIERALFQEFQRVLVMPNMDDLQLELMESDV